ncbi:hypothetical protein MN116_002830 [Schistosoma mekongi]|uniref:glycerol-3-phosphate dehydrogenase n=1 Tax=Schistosoma mekongi TaxID=38744 RepID=A0AAE1ZGD8_SCHME|nr:hypothetical protein MN116_002830 [Schistosoma mekongi]
MIEFIILMFNIRSIFQMSTFRNISRKLVIVGALSGVGAALLLEVVPKVNETRRSKVLLSKPKPSEEELKRFERPLPTRDEHLKRMASGEIFDVLIIGGGATGAGVALDAASRAIAIKRWKFDLCILKKTAVTHFLFCPTKMGLLDPDTRDGRVIFFLPWMNYALAGTTDSECSVTDHPSPSESEVNFILEEISSYLSSEIQVRRGDVLSAWAGIRPLVRDPNSSDTQSIARNHIIDVSPSKLITIAGGKWTTYRSMAEETVDKAIKVCGLKPTSPCRTKGLLLEGAHGWSPNLFIQIVQEYGMDVDVARHLTGIYGDKAITIANMSKLTGLRWPILGKKLHPEFPFIEAEVEYACREYACHVVDFLARRTRLAFLNVRAAEEALPRIVDLMGEHLKWNSERKKQEMLEAENFLKSEMGLNLRVMDGVRMNLNIDEINDLLQSFRKLDHDTKGYVSLNDLRKFCIESGESVSEEALQATLNTMDINKNGQVDMSEFLQFMSAIKSGVVVNSPLKKVLNRTRIPVYRSGGGV